MADTISELYEKYTGQVGEALEDDRYFQYLFEMVQAGNNTLQQQYRVLHKVVDERWLTVVEEGIEAIFNIVDKPRRFIATSEEVVPVALAKKITPEGGACLLSPAAASYGYFKNFEERGEKFMQLVREVTL